MLTLKLKVKFFIVASYKTPHEEQKSETVGKSQLHRSLEK